MELKDFVKKVLLDLDEAVTEVNQTSKRKVKFRGVKETRTSIEFDVAVTAESNLSEKGGGEVKVLGIGQAGIGLLSKKRSETVSRVSFCLDIDELTREERKNNQLIG